MSPSSNSLPGPSALSPLSPSSTGVDVTPDEVLARASAILSAHTTVAIASSGAKYSPWILNAYFAEVGTTLFAMLEKSGKTMANLRSNARVAIVVSVNDPTKDFLQAVATAEILDDRRDAEIRERLVGKIPYFQTLTPCAPVALRLDEIFVSSFASGWFPAKVWRKP